MTKTFTALATIAVLLSPAAFAESKTFAAKPFSKIEVNGIMTVVHKTAAETKVTVETENGDFSDAKITNDGDTLIVSRNSLDKKGGFFNWGGTNVDVSRNGETIKVNGKKVPRYTVYVTGPDLEEVRVKQSSKFTSETIDAGDFDASASSSSTATLAGKSGATSLAASSSGTIKAAGLKAASLDAAASSSGDLSASVTGTGTVKVAASSSGDVEIVSSGAAKFDVDASSGGSVELSGACASITASASSGGDIDAEDLICTTGSAQASSGGEIDIHASASATGKASSGGDINFSGSAKQQTESHSSGGSVSFSN